MCPPPPKKWSEQKETWAKLGASRRLQKHRFHAFTFFWGGGTTLDSSKVNHSTHLFLLQEYKLHKKLVGLVDLHVPLLLPLVKLEEVWVVRRREGVPSHRGHKRFGQNFWAEKNQIKSNVKIETESQPSRSQNFRTEKIKCNPSHRGHNRFGENFRTENEIIRQIRIRPLTWVWDGNLCRH